MSSDRQSADDASAYAARHIRLGLWALVVYTALGLALEGLHAFKWQGYLAVTNETRRLMWTLAHSHGTLVALVNVAYGACLRAGAIGSRHPRIVWQLLAGATILLPLGFFLGGVRFYSGDPGVGASLVPLGAVALLGGLVLAAVDAVDADGSPAGSGQTPRRRST